MDESDWAFGPEQIALLSHYVTRMHELNSDRRNVLLQSSHRALLLYPLYSRRRGYLLCLRPHLHREQSGPFCWRPTRRGLVVSPVGLFFFLLADSDAALTMMMMMIKRGTRSHSDSLANAVAPRPQMNFDSGQMSFLCQLRE